MTTGTSPPTASSQRRQWPSPDPVPVTVKICGINAPDAMAAAIEGGAGYVGLMFYPPSPRFLALDQAARLAALVPDGIARVGRRFVNLARGPGSGSQPAKQPGNQRDGPWPSSARRSIDRAGTGRRTTLDESSRCLQP